MNVLSLLIKGIGDKKLKKYFAGSDGITYEAVTLPVSTQRSTSLYCTADKTEYYFGDDASDEVVDDYLVTGIDTAYLTFAIATGLKELALRKIFKSETEEEVSAITSWSFPSNCLGVGKIYLEDELLTSGKVVYSGSKSSFVRDYRIKDRTVQFTYAVTGTLRVEMYILPDEDDIIESDKEAVNNYALAMAYGRMASVVKRDKTIEMEGVPKITDLARSFEEDSKMFMDRFREHANKPYVSIFG